MRRSLRMLASCHHHSAPVARPRAGQITGIVQERNATRRRRPRARGRGRRAGLPEPHVALTARTASSRCATSLPASYTVTVTRTGYATHTLRTGTRAAATPVQSLPATAVSNLDFVLAPGGHIAGRILDEDGTPFAGADVEALTSRFGSGARRAGRAATTADRRPRRVPALRTPARRVRRERRRSRVSRRAHAERRPALLADLLPGRRFADQATAVIVRGRHRHAPRSNSS